jgi:NAD(P)-dependent dehydrogenase (short-subunit alcohol dehydrogenase family)
VETRTAFVTGASRGIGKACALSLAEAGFDVAIAARTLVEGEGRDESVAGRDRPVSGSLETTAGLIQARGRRALPVALDLGDRASLEEATARVLDAWGRVDVLVNNAVHTGPGSMDRVEDLDLATLEAKLWANATAQVALIKLVVPGMLERGKGTIVDMTSEVAVSDPPVPAGEGGWGLAYAMSKGAFHRVAGILAVELGPRGLRAFNVDPGFVLTERMTVNQQELGLEGRYRGAPPTVPAEVVTWLATSPDADAFNGQTVRAQKLALELGLHPDWRTGS